MDNLVTLVDMDNNGVIDFNEFLNLIANLESKEQNGTDGKLVIRDKPGPKNDNFSGIFHLRDVNNNDGWLLRIK